MAQTKIFVRNMSPLYQWAFNKVIPIKAIKAEALSKLRRLRLIRLND